MKKSFDAGILQHVASTVWGPMDSDMAKNAQSAFYSILNSVDDDTKLEFFEGALKGTRLGQKDKIQVDHK